MKKTASKVAKPTQIQPKSQFLFHKKTHTAGLLYNDFASEQYKLQKKFHLAPFIGTHIWIDRETKKL